MHFRRTIALGWIFLLACVPARAAERAFPAVIAGVQPKIVKVHGAGSVQKLEAYQSGFLISSEGHILTVWSYVLDTEQISVTLDDGRKLKAELLNIDPRLEIAILKVAAKETPHFHLDDAATLETGDRVLAFSNLFGVATGNEAASVLHGSVMAKTNLAARRGAFETPYKGVAYVLDAMTNNPGAAGGALTDRSGRLVGMLGKELRNSQNNTWLNYALPIEELKPAIEDILAGKTPARTRDDSARKKPRQPLTLSLLGVVLVPDVLAKTPPFVDQVRSGSAAERAGLRPDDLILFVNDRIVASCKELLDELSYVDRIDAITITVQRRQQLMEIELKAAE